MNYFKKLSKFKKLVIRSNINGLVFVCGIYVLAVWRESDLVNNKLITKFKRRLALQFCLLIEIKNI